MLRASETCCGHIRCDFSGLEGSKPSSCTFYFFALKSSFCYSHGCNPHPGGILRSKANAPPVLKLVCLPMNILVSFDGEYHTSWINHKLFTNKSPQHSFIFPLPFFIINNNCFFHDIIINIIVSTIGNFTPLYLCNLNKKKKRNFQKLTKFSADFVRKLSKKEGILKTCPLSSLPQKKIMTRVPGTQTFSKQKQKSSAKISDSKFSFVWAFSVMPRGPSL